MPNEAWLRAQSGERSFHCTDDGYRAVRRKFEQQKRQQYAALMLLNEESAMGKRVLDLGCGPSSLLLDYPVDAEGCVALDPLTFLPEDEASYATCGIPRHIGAAEDYVPPTGGFDEVWMYNCLQHVMDPVAVCRVAASATKGVVRVFEYVGVPTDELHLHTLTPAMIAGAFDGMNCYSQVLGTMRMGSGGGVSFYAAVFLHRSIDPEHWS